MKIYRNYGVLGAEKRFVYTGRPISNLYEELEIEIPAGWEAYETVTGSVAVSSPWGWNYSLDEVLTGDDRPMFWAITAEGKYYSRVLKIVE